MLPYLLIQLTLSFCALVMATRDKQSILYKPTDLKPTLADLLTIDRSVSIFYSYARETDFSNRFGDASQNITVTAPTNKAVIALPRKPHQGAKPDVEDMPEISQTQYDFVSKENVEKWVGAHIIPSPVALSSSEETYDTLLPGNKVTFYQEGKSKDPSWSDYRLKEGISIVGMAEASNGILYIVDGTELY